MSIQGRSLRNDVGSSKNKQLQNDNSKRTKKITNEYVNTANKIHTPTHSHTKKTAKRSKRKMNNQGRSLLRLVDADSQSTADKWHLIAVAHLRVRRRRRQTEPNNKSRSETKHEKKTTNRPGRSRVPTE